MKVFAALLVFGVGYPAFLIGFAWMLDNVRVYRERRGLNVYVGKWACRYSWSHTGMFSNGSRWSSGWHRWKDDAFDAWCEGRL